MDKINIDLERLHKEGIFVMVPAYAGQCFASFTRSMMQLSALCSLYSIPMDCFFISNESLITRARNYCVDEFLRRKFSYRNEKNDIEQKLYQHAMFIDTDIEFNAIDVLVMAHIQSPDSDYDVLCGPYPKKTISYEKIKEAVEKGFANENPENLSNFVGDYVFNTKSKKDISLVHPAEIYEGGTGFMMISRKILSTVEHQHPNIKYKPDHIRTANFDGSRMINAFFDTSIDKKTKRYLSEDYHFCKLVRNSGGKVWLLPWIQLKHHGYFVYGGSLVALSQANLSATVDSSKIKKVRE